MRKLRPAESMLVIWAFVIFILTPLAFARMEAKKHARIAKAGNGENVAPFIKPLWLKSKAQRQSSVLYINTRTTAAAPILWEDDFEGNQAPWTPVASWTNTPVNPADLDAGFVFGDHSGWSRVDTISQRPPSPKHAWRNDDDENTAIDLLISPVIHLPKTVEGKPLLQAWASFYIDLNAPDVESEGNLQDFFYMRAGRAEALWQFETVAPFSGTSHWALRPDSSGAKGAFNVQALLTPEIDLAGAIMPVLNFAQRYLTEANFDYCAVDISSDQFASYKTLARYSGARPAYARVAVSLKNYTEEKIRLRFRFISDFSFSPLNAHWFIDNIAVQDSTKIFFSDQGGDDGRTSMSKWGFAGGDVFIGLDYDKDPGNSAALWLKKDGANIDRGSLNIFDSAAGIAPGDSIRLAFHWVTNGSLAPGNGRGIFIDQVALTAATGIADDIAILDLDVPFPNIETVAAQTAVVRVGNRGFKNQNAAPVHYHLNDGAAPVSSPALLFDLAAASEKSGAFNWQTPAPGVYRLTAFADLAADLDRSNDTLRVAPVAIFPNGMAELGYDDRFNQNVFITGSKSLVSFTVQEDLRGAAQKYALHQVKADLFNDSNSNDQVRIVVAAASNDTTLQTVLFEKIEPVPARDFSPHVFFVNAQNLTAGRFVVLVDFSVSNGNARLLMDGRTPFAGHNFFLDGRHWSPSNLGRQIRATISWLEPPKIISVRDLPNDQGKHAQVSWFPAASETFSRDIAHYILWRVVKNPGVADTNFRVIEVPNLPALYEYGIQNGKPGDRLVVTGNGAWDFIVSMSAHAGFGAYSNITPTLVDSNTTGINYTAFMVSAYNKNREFTDAKIDSGYSRDNLAPGMPPGFTATRIAVNQRPAVQLKWNAVADKDLAQYAIYKNGGSAPLATTRDLVFTDLAVTVGTAVNYSLAAFDVNGNESPRTNFSLTITRVAERAQPALPTAYELGNNYPNPFNPQTTIAFALPVRGHAKLVLFNFLGQEIATLIDAEMPAGFHKVVWEGAGQPSGIYFYRLTVNDFTQLKKMVLMQ